MHKRLVHNSVFHKLGNACALANEMLWKLHVAHDVPMAGYLALEKKFARVRKRFWWPGASLILMSIMGVKWIAMDVIGHLLRILAKKQYCTGLIQGIMHFHFKRVCTRM